MNLPARRVRQLHLRAPTDPAARRLEVALADALRTASLPGDQESRIVVIRRLDLGRLAPGLAPASLALRLEHAARELAPRALPADSPAADHADAVFFADRADLLLRLARRVLAEGPAAARAWYWRAALPAWNAEQSPPQALRQLLDLAHALPEAVLVVARLLHLVLVTGNVDGLRAAVPAGQGRRWLRQLGWAWPSSTSRDASRAATELPLLAAVDSPGSTPLTSDGTALRDLWNPEDDRALWAATVNLAGQNPGRATLADLPARALRQLRAEPEAHVAKQSVARSRDSRDTSTSTPPSPAAVPPGRRAAPDPTDSPSRPPPEKASPDRTPFAHPAANDPLTTHAGGLLFLVPALQRLGWPGDASESAPAIEEGWGARLLLDLATRAGTPAEDPLVVVLRGMVPDALRPPRELSAAGVAHARAWRGRLRRWFRTTVRLGLRNLIRRPARLQATSTHLDLTFDLDRCDVRLRRWGLDLDPGWVPWLGRVLTFHYD